MKKFEVRHEIKREDGIGLGMARKKLTDTQRVGDHLPQTDKLPKEKGLACFLGEGVM